MAKTYIVSKAFQSTDKDTKEPQIIKTKNGDMHKFMVQVENQPIAGWIGMLKKIGNEINVGDELYGVIDDNEWGKPQFTAIQRPQGMAYKTNTPKTTTTPTADTSDLGVKIDYLISLVENFLESQGVSKPKAVNADTQDDDGEINLDALPY